MYYAHKGSSSDNAFTTFNGHATRQFYAFNTKAERQAFQDNVWKESNHQQNVIFCTAKFAKKWLNKNFYVDQIGQIWQSYEEFEMAKEDEKYLASQQ